MILDKKNINRETAIRWLAQYEINNLSLEERESILLDWWYHDEENPEYFILSDELKFEVKNLDMPENPNDAKYNILILEYLISKYKGVINTYIESKLNSIGILNVTIFGEEETLIDCLCCGYRTIDERGNYDICKVCFWEDDGNFLDPECYSSANRMNLSQARINFNQIGACSIEDLKFIDKDGAIKYKHK